VEHHQEVLEIMALVVVVALAKQEKRHLQTLVAAMVAMECCGMEAIMLVAVEVQMEMHLEPQFLAAVALVVEAVEHFITCRMEELLMRQLLVQLILVVVAAAVELLEARHRV
jgi:hypothetical protein